jgi:hypothetical protein
MFPFLFFCSIDSVTFFSLGELLDADVLDLLENLETDHKQHLSFLIRKLCSNPAVHSKSNHTDLQEVFRASSMLRDVSMDSQQLVQHGGMGMRDSASVRV